MISPSVRVLRDAWIPGRDAVTPTKEPDGVAESDQDELAARFADGLVASADDALSLVERIMRLIEEDERRIGALSKAAHSARRVHLALQRSPVIALPSLLQETGLRVQAATSALHRLRALGIVREITGRHRHCLYSYDAYVTLLSHDLW
jgi:Fic family protein